MADEQTQAKTQDWKCNFCNREDGVINGFCPDCGATQTTPQSDAAKKEAGVYVEPEETKPGPASTEAQSTSESA